MTVVCLKRVMFTSADLRGMRARTAVSAVYPHGVWKRQLICEELRSRGMIDEKQRGSRSQTQAG
eukprot:IDg19914t1